MEWIKATIDTMSGAEDDISYMLNTLGIIGVEIEDKVPVGADENGGYFGEVVPELPEDDHRARISFYIKKPGSGDSILPENYDPGTGPVDLPEPEGSLEEILDRVRAGLAEIGTYCSIGPGTISLDTTQEEDWANSWKEHFHRFTVEGVAIVPSWEEGAETEDADITLRLDPGTAFGTGQHESTRLAIRALRKYLKGGDRLLDIGTGSGILGLIALKDGAAEVFATDLDPNVPAALRENLIKNEIPETAFHLAMGNLADDPAVSAKALEASGGQGYDLVTANIIAEILAGLTPAVPPLLKEGGVYIMSGILRTHAQIVRDALAKEGLAILEEETMGEWESIAARK
ncbi:MAG: 50S ribosomal protein L11 methyltransferase [Lachnospiraceae bacterium]|nr:50S ribosomal protein L11 methyltransferase [Lachnospiraceae bacterium]